MQKIAIIGGSGFIGTKLVSLLLAQGYQVSILDIQKSQTYPDLWVACDIRQKKDLQKNLQHIDIVYNLAAEHKDNVEPVSKYYETNVEAAQTLCDVLDEVKIKKLIFTSTVAVYGFPTDEPDEDRPFSPFNDYGKSKAQAEAVYEKWVNSGKTKDKSLVIVRPTAVFGPGNRGNVFNLIRQVASGKFLMLGNGKNKKSLSYIDNVASFLEFTLSFDGGTHIFNYIDKPDYSMKEFVNKIRWILGKPSVRIQVPYPIAILGGAFFDSLAKILKKEFPISKIRVQKFCTQTVFKAEKVKQSGFVAPVTLAQGLEKTIHSDILNKS